MKSKKSKPKPKTKSVAKKNIVKKPAAYDHSKIESKWQKSWTKGGVYKTKNDSKAEKYYVLDMFPYPSGEGLHVGHPKGYIATDIISRMKRMQGFNVLHPMGFDAFGLPAEQYAIKMKTNPAISVKKSVQRFKKQLEILGLDYDWSREISTTDPDFYKWTQWIFLQLYKKGLAYESYEPINWCPVDKTGLANEDVVDGKCERCGAVVEKKPMRQWVLKITDYADRLLKDLDAVEYDMPKLVDEVNPHQPGKPLIERSVAHAIVFDPKNKKYLIIRNKKFGWDTVVIGGIEGSESAVETAMREVKEETGYVDIEFKRILGGQTEAQYYTKHKGENRVAWATGVYFELKSDKRVEIGVDEDKENEILWINEKDFAPGKMVNSELPIWLERIKDPKKGWPKPLLDWPESIKESQRNWIGRSEGVNFKCRIKDLNIKVEMYNSVPQSYHAETFTVIAPDHPLVPELVKGTEHEKKVLAFVEELKKKKAANKFDLDKDIEGIFTGRYIEKFADTGRDLPIWIASYVVLDYGTGIVNCSAHDVRDFAFAKKYNIPLHPVMVPADEAEAKKVLDTEYCYAKDPNAVMLEPKKFKGRKWGEVRQDVIDHVVESGFGTRKVNYKLRDWVFSRQRYWGEPIPLLRSPEGKIEPLNEKDLPLKLPMVKSYEPTGTGESPLAGIPSWINVKKGKEIWKRESNTMPQWAGSSWYYLRYMDPKNKKNLVDPKIEKYWNAVDFYVGGAEHATRHLIYARFWHKFLFDIGAVSTIEPFKKLQSVGLILAEDGRKMSKRWGNVINPDDIVSKYGADTLRMYEMFMGPFDQAIAWNTESMIGPRRFIERVWNLRSKVKKGEANSEIDSLVHKTIKKVGDDIVVMGFNTAISTLMILLNALEKEEFVSKEHYKILLQLLAPFAPHVSEELWTLEGNKKSIHQSKWPEFDPKKLVSTSFNIVVQINGKVRASFISDSDNEEIVKKYALEHPVIVKWLAGKEPVRIIYVAQKLVNIVVPGL